MIPVPTSVKLSTLSAGIPLLIATTSLLAVALLLAYLAQVEKKFNDFPAFLRDHYAETREFW